MIHLSGKEAYALFLESEFWKRISFDLRQRAGFRCGRCSKPDHCQAHHRIYRDHWFDTRLEDLECICLECHQKEHGITKPPAVWTLEALQAARAAQQIGREEYLRIRKTIPHSLKAVRTQKKRGGRPAKRKARFVKRKGWKGKRNQFKMDRYGNFVIQNGRPVYAP